MLGGRRAVGTIVAVILIAGVATWRVVRAVERATSPTSHTFTLATPAPDPWCAEPQNSYASGCSQNPCNPTTVYYRPADPGCQSPAPAPITASGAAAPTGHHTSRR